MSAARHRARARCEVSAEAALAFLADGRQIGRWALGCWQAESADEVNEAGVTGKAGVVRGYSLFDGRPSWVRPVLDARRGAVTYHVGDAPGALRPSILARVVPGPGQTHCQVTLETERASDMNDARWLRLRRCHEVEVLLIQALLARPGA